MTEIRCTVTNDVNDEHVLFVKVDGKQMHWPLNGKASASIQRIVPVRTGHADAPAFAAIGAKASPARDAPTAATIPFSYKSFTLCPSCA
jgi:hypothetical protein